MEMSGIEGQTWQSVISNEKYGFAVWYDSWEQDYGNIPSTAEELGLDEGLAQALGIPTEDTYGLLREWNNVRSIDPRHFLPDPAFPVCDVQNMGYVGHTDYLNWMYMEERRIDQDQGPYFNVDLARKYKAGTFDRREWDSRSVDGEYMQDVASRTQVGRRAAL